MPTSKRHATENRYIGPDPTLPITTPFPVPVPTISNVVAGLSLNCLLDLPHIAKSARNAVYRPRRFPAVILRLRAPKATALLFSKGRMQVLGTKSVEAAHLAARKFARMVQKMGYEPRITEFVVQNVVGNADLGMVVRLEGLYAWVFGVEGKEVSYEPELFPGLILRLGRPEMTMLVFAKGKVVFLGGKCEGDLREALGRTWGLLARFRQGPAA